jgi:hypothetical protein
VSLLTPFSCFRLRASLSRPSSRTVIRLLSNWALRVGSGVGLGDEDGAA